MCFKLCKTMKARTKDGRTVIIRRPRMSDVKQLLNLINSLVEEDAQILVNKKMSLKDEKKWLKGKLEDIRKNKQHCLLALIDDEVVGNVELKKGYDRASHVAEYAISVKKGYRRLGIATILSKRILDIGKKDKSIKVITLYVFSSNPVAMNFYKKLGFKKVAVLKKRALIKGKYVDDIVMDLVK